MSRNNLRTIWPQLLGYFVLSLFAFSAPAWAAPNAPTINTLEGKNVIVGQTLYLNLANNITVVGNAEANKTIKLFDGASQIGSTTSNASGAYSLDINLAAGSHTLKATASDVSGESAPSPDATLLIDLTKPSLGYAWFRNVGWSTLGSPPHRMLRYSTGSIMQADVSDSGGSGLDFTTMSIKLYDLGPWNALYGTPVEVAGSTSHDGVSALKYDPITSAEAGQNNHKYMSVTSISDRAGNVSTATADWYYDVTPPSAPVVTKIYDPGHSSFTGSGEPTSNTPDGEGYVNYYSGMTISSQPIRIRGRVPNVGVYEAEPTSAPVGGSFEAYNVYSSLHDSHWTTCTATTPSMSIHGSSMSLATGDFTIIYPTGDPNYIFPEGNNNIAVRSVDTALSTTQTTINLTFVNGAPRPPGRPSGFSGAEMRIGPSLDFPMTFPTFDGLAQTSSSDQSVCIYRGGFYSFPDYNYTNEFKVCQVVRPSGQSYSNVAGAYNPGDTWHDRNNNWIYDVGEEYSDSSSALPNPSDGRTYHLVNVRNLATPLGESNYIGIGAANPVGQSAKQRVARLHYQTTQPQLQSVELGPVNSNQLNLSQKPTSITVKSRTFGEDWCTFCHGLDTGVSKISILNNGGTDVSSALSTSWSYTGSNLLYFGVLNTTGLSLGEGTYTLKVEMKDASLNTRTDTSYQFKLDNSAPTATNILPGNGTVSSIPSFNADIVDPNLSDGTPGTGASLNLAQNQIDPYKRLGSATASSSNSLTVTLNASDAPVGGQAVNHRGSPLAPGTGVQVWDNTNNAIVNLVTVGNSTASNASVTVNSGNTLTVSVPGGNLISGRSYTVYYQIPHFDSNDGVKKVAAVPTQTATSPGLYASRITGVDFVGNVGTTVSTTSIQMDPPVGTITLTPAASDVFILSPSPNERTTVTSNVIQGSSGTVVPDGTLVTVSLSGPGTLVEPDANGIAADGHQIATAANGAGAGRIRFTVRANNNTSLGAVSVNISVGAASGNTTVTMRRPIVSLTKSANKSTVVPGDEITYTLSYSNTGNSTAQNVTLTDLLPAEVSFVPGSVLLQGSPLSDAAVYTATPAPSGRIRYNVGSVAASATGTLSFRVKVN